MTWGPGDMTAVDVRRAVRTRQLSQVEITSDAFRRMDKWEPRLGAVVQRMQLARTTPDSDKLIGVTVGIKDIIAIAGVVRGCGAAEFLNARPEPRHAAVVSRLLDAGATVVATLSLPQLAYSPITPQTLNPRAPGRLLGGSSGGSAAAVAAGLVHVALGTDTGGSIRCPAATCGLVGLRPTRGLLPLDGVQPLTWSLDTVGPIAATVADLALVMGTLADTEADGPAHRKPGFLQHAPTGPGLRVGVLRQIQASLMDSSVRTLWETVLARLGACGAEIVAIDLAILGDAQDMCRTIVIAEAYAIHEANYRSRNEFLWPQVRARLAEGEQLQAASAVRAMHFMSEFQAAVHRTFEDVDVLVVPTMPCCLPLTGAEQIVVGGEPEGVAHALTRYTQPWSLAGVPVGSVPAGTDDAGAPIGMQVIAPWFGEAAVMHAMQLIETHHGWHPTSS